LIVLLAVHLFVVSKTCYSDFCYKVCISLPKVLSLKTIVKILNSLWKILEYFFSSTVVTLFSLDLNVPKMKYIYASLHSERAYSVLVKF